MYAAATDFSLASQLLQKFAVDAYLVNDQGIVGASLLAMVVNDDAAVLNVRGGLGFFVGTPPGAGSLPQ